MDRLSRVQSNRKRIRPPDLPSVHVGAVDLTGNNPDPAKAPDIVNNSFGCSSSDCQLEPAYDNLAAAGILSVAAAGNSGPSSSSLSEPAVYSSVLDVSGLGDRTNDIAFFSSRGPLDGAFSKPEIAAPASNISSAIVGKFDDYGIMSGTSMASPAVAGALERETGPDRRCTFHHDAA